MERGCEWPAGCNRAASAKSSCLTSASASCACAHAGAVWNERKRANRVAGLCACGAEPTPGWATCERCRKRAREDRRRARAFAARAAECGIVLPRENGRRRAFLQAYAEAFKRSQRAARRAWRRAWARGSLRSLSDAFTATVAVPWEGHSVTVQATMDYGAGGMRVRGIPA